MMAIHDVARAAVAWFPEIPVTTPDGQFSLPVIMVAIAGAEDEFGAAPGDPLSIYHDPEWARPYSCEGYTSFGTWQVNLPWNHDVVERLSGISAGDPCGQAAWLADYDNCARASLAIYNSQGLGAWSTWWSDARNQVGGGQGVYRRYLIQAQEAVAALKTPVPAPAPVPLPPVDDGRLRWILAGSLGLVALVLGFSLLESRRSEFP